MMKNDEILGIYIIHKTKASCFIKDRINFPILLLWYFTGYNCDIKCYERFYPYIEMYLAFLFYIVLYR